jgi:ABC-type Fe3+ transport system permease subunit
MNFFEYLFCRLYWWNTQIIKEDIVPIFYSIIGLSAFQTYTIFPLYAMIYSLCFHSYHVGYILGRNVNICLVITTIVVIINFIYFKKQKYKILQKKFNKIPKEQKRKKDILCIVYIVTIVVVNIFFVVYFRAHNVSI